MDFSEKYIKMCQKAEEIQIEWKPKVGDWVIDVWNRERPLVICAVRDNPDYFYLSDQFASDKENIYQNHISKLYWLPRQDQLQEMLNLKVIKYGLLNKIDNILYKVYKDKYISGFAFDSFEQLWLAFVMYKKYGKIWDNKKEEWIKREIKNEKTYYKN